MQGTYPDVHSRGGEEETSWAGLGWAGLGWAGEARRITPHERRGTG
ncbi:hypothetical protein [Amycolatopsis panacis]|nr:hypothetical protein [Amycolatopsis panacis]